MAANTPDFVIQTGIEIPTIQRDSKYPWDQMNDGDSIFFDAENALAATQSARLYVKNRRPNLSVVTRSLEEGGVSGTRIWFVEQSDEGEEEYEEA